MSEETNRPYCTKPDRRLIQKAYTKGYKKTHLLVGPTGTLFYFFQLHDAFESTKRKKKLEEPSTKTLEYNT